MAVKFTTVDSIGKLKTALKRGSGGWIQNIPDGETTVRFLLELTDWGSFLEHYDPVRKFFPCADDCPGCAEGLKKSKRWLAPALDVENGNRVQVYKLPLTVVQFMVKYYEKNGTVTDRDFTLEREGSGIETSYMVMQLAKRYVNLDKYEIPDMEAMLNSMVEDDNDDEDEEDSPPPPKRRTVPPSKAATSAKVVRRRAPVIEEDDEEEVAPRRARATAPVRRAIPARQVARTVPAPPARRNGAAVNGTARTVPLKPKARTLPPATRTGRPVPREEQEVALRPRKIVRRPVVDDDEPPF